jgi:hypothetical protein
MVCLSGLSAANSAACENWLAFFHEGGAPFSKVCAVETRSHQLVAMGYIAH